MFTSEFYKSGKFQTITSNWNNLVIPPYKFLSDAKIVIGVGEGS